MGLFNFIYKLTNILSNKRKIKLFFIIGIIILLLFCWSRGAFASTPEDDEALMLYQLQLQESMISYLRQMNEVKAQGFDQSAFNQLLTALRNYQVYVIVPTGDPNCNYWVYFYNSSVGANNNNLFTTDATWSVGFNSGTEYPCKVGSFETSRFARIVHQYGNRVTPIISSETTSFLLPSACYCVRSTSINDYLESMGLYSNITPTYETHDSELQAVVSSGMQQQVNAINQVDDTLNDVNSSVEDVNQSVNEMIETIVAPYVNVSQEQLPTQSVTDTTETPLNTLFDYIKDAFTGEPTGFSLPLPFVRWRS